MCSCAQSSQRATWPPSAAVRQRSIAFITFSCARLTCPALARRQAGPWSRKMSATSSEERGKAAARYAVPSPDFRRLLRRRVPRSSSGLITAAIMPVATRA